MFTVQRGGVVNGLGVGLVIRWIRRYIVSFLAIPFSFSASSNLTHHMLLSTTCKIWYWSKDSDLQQMGIYVHRPGRK